MPRPAPDRRRVFGDRLRALRLQVGISQEELADRAGLHRTYVSSVERGQRNLTLSNIHALADALGVDVRAFFETSDATNSDAPSADPRDF